jgi:hypothetical protein
MKPWADNTRDYTCPLFPRDTIKMQDIDTLPSVVCDDVITNQAQDIDTLPSVVFEDVHTRQIYAQYWYIAVSGMWRCAHN